MSPQKDTQEKSQADPQAESQAEPQSAPTEPNASVPSAGVVWVRISPNQVMRTVVVALLSAAVVLGSLFLAAVLSPAVNWLQRRHRLIKRPLAIALTYLGLVVALLFIVGILLPLLVDQIQGLIKFVAAVAQAPEGPTEYLKGLARQYHLGWVFERFSHQIDAIRSQLGGAASNFLLSTGDVIVSAAGFVAALVTVLTLTFFLILGGERYLNAGVEL